VARAVCPRGAVDLAVAYHHRGDALMVDAFKAEDHTDKRYRDKVTRAVQLRLQVIEDKEAVRRGATLFALPMYAPDGAKLVWGTADAIWTALGDTSDDFNWYSCVFRDSAVLAWRQQRRPRAHLGFSGAAHRQRHAD